MNLNRKKKVHVIVQQRNFELKQKSKRELEEEEMERIFECSKHNELINEIESLLQRYPDLLNCKHKKVCLKTTKIQKKQLIKR